MRARHFSFVARARDVPLRNRLRADENKISELLMEAGVNYTECADRLRRSTPDAKELTQL